MRDAVSAPAPQHLNERTPRAAWIALQSLHLTLGAVRLTAFVLLRLAEPLVRVAFTALGLLGILMALFYRLVASPPHSPFWLLLGFSLLCGGVLLVYEQLLHLLAKGTRS